MARWIVAAGLGFLMICELFFSVGQVFADRAGSGGSSSSNRTIGVVPQTQAPGQPTSTGRSSDASGDTTKGPARGGTKAPSK